MQIYIEYIYSLDTFFNGLNEYNVAKGSDPNTVASRQKTEKNCGKTVSLPVPINVTIVLFFKKVH